VVFAKLRFKTTTSQAGESYKLLFSISHRSNAATIHKVAFGKNGKKIEGGFEQNFSSTVDDLFVFVKGYGPLELHCESVFEYNGHRHHTHVPQTTEIYKKVEEDWFSDEFFVDPFTAPVGSDFILVKPKTDDLIDFPLDAPAANTREAYIKQLLDGDVPAATNYQYAKTQRPLSEIDPLSTIFVKNDSDIIEAIDLAAKKGYSIAVRSGGHSYCGASSGKQKTIQLDLGGRSLTEKERESYPYSQISYEYDDKQNKKKITTVICGVGNSLYHLQIAFRKHGLSVPTGMCWDIYVGGHCQSGGIGAAVIPFGLFIDHIRAIRIILPRKIEQWNNEQIGWIDRDTKDPFLADIFYSAIGGSPGNFGVITHVKIKPIHDTDHPNSHGCMKAWIFNKEAYDNILEVLDDMVKSEKYPKDFGVAIFILGGSIFFSAREWFNKIERKWTIDSAMATHHKKLYGINDFEPNPVDVIIFTGIWANLDKSQYTEKESHYFRKFVDAVEKVPDIIEIPAWFGRFFGWEFFDSIDPGKKYTPISDMWWNWSVRKTRVYEYPIKDAASVLSLDYIAKNKWTSLVSGAANKYYPTFLNDQTCGIVIQPTGGKTSGYHDDDGKTSYSWRSYEGPKGGALMVDMAVYWDPKAFDSFMQGVEIVKNEFPKCFYDDGWKHRMNWAPSFHYHKGRSMDKHWQQFFDSEAKYKRIYNTKIKLDPGRIFTPNPFCVGYYPEPKLTNSFGDEKKMPIEDLQNEFKIERILVKKETEIIPKDRDGGDRKIDVTIADEKDGPSLI